MDRQKQNCPYCQESIYANAIVCRYCTRDLPPNLPPLPAHSSSPAWIPLLITSALILGAVALFTSEQMQARLSRLQHKDS